MPLRSYAGKEPLIEKGAYIDRDSLLIGEVHIGTGATIWPGTILRADDDRIEVDEGAAVLDMAFVEAPEGKPVRIGKGCIISHGARLHGCRIEDGAMVGVGAIVLDAAVIGRDAILGAGGVVPPGDRIPAMSLAIGSPARVLRELTEADLAPITEGLRTIAEKAAQYGKESEDREANKGTNHKSKP